MDGLSQLTPEQMANTPASKPPSGVVPNFDDPYSAAPIVISVGTILLAIMLAIVGLRFYEKAVVRKNFSADDWTAVAAVIGTLFYYGVCVYAVTGGKFGTHMWDISIAETLSNGFLISSFLLNWPTALVWALAKTCFFLMYIRMFGTLRWMRICSYIGLLVNWGFYTPVIILSIYWMAPNPGQSWQEGLGNSRYSDTFAIAVPITCVSLALDTYILVLPLIALSGLRLSRNKKIGVIAVFGTGLIACVASSMNIYFKQLLTHHENDYTYWTYPVLLVSLIEMCIGITCASMPTAAGFWKTKTAKYGTPKYQLTPPGMRFNVMRSSRRARDKIPDSLEMSWRGMNTKPGESSGEQSDTSHKDDESLQPILEPRDIHVRHDIHVSSSGSGQEESRYVV